MFAPSLYFAKISRYYVHSHANWKLDLWLSDGSKETTCSSLSYEFQREQHTDEGKDKKNKKQIRYEDIRVDVIILRGCRFVALFRVSLFILFLFFRCFPFKSHENINSERMFAMFRSVYADTFFSSLSVLTCKPQFPTRSNQTKTLFNKTKCK